MQHGFGRCRLQGDSEQAPGVADVHRRPPVRAVADVGGGPEPAVQADERGDEAVPVALPVHGARHAHEAGADAALRQGQHRPGRAGAHPGGALGIQLVLLGGELPEARGGAGRGEERPARALERVADPRDEAHLVLDGGVERVEVEGEREVRGGVGGQRLGDQQVVIGHVAPHGGGADPADPLGGGVRADQAADLVPGGDELGGEGGADPTGGPGDECAHASAPVHDGVTAICRAPDEPIPVM
ncbi:hypothetical protein QFZ62_002292 [Clavibacter sp. B3I6]|nr:hypothetical protein [Clavibacter sp. B3I6]MDQ0744984.1 hypothetical protein [Clavibacter sp. B3I6]